MPTHAASWDCIDTFWDWIKILQCTFHISASKHLSTSFFLKGFLCRTLSLFQQRTRSDAWVTPLVHIAAICRLRASLRWCETFRNWWGKRVKHTEFSKRLWKPWSLHEFTMSSTGCPRIGRARRRGATVEFRRNFFTEVHQHRGTSPPLPEQELLDCVSDGDGEPLDSLEERCKQEVVLENLWRFTFVFWFKQDFNVGIKETFWETLRWTPCLALRLRWSWTIASRPPFLSRVCQKSPRRSTTSFSMFSPNWSTSALANFLVQFLRFISVHVCLWNAMWECR